MAKLKIRENLHLEIVGVENLREFELIKKAELKIHENSYFAKIQTVSEKLVRTRLYLLKYT